MTTRLGVVRYLNTLPLIEGLEKFPELHLAPAAPAGLAQSLLQRDTDLALISVVDAFRTSQESPLTLLPVGMIGCDGPTMTVRLISRIPPARITTLTADDESHTSIALCRIILQELHQATPTIAPRTAADWLDDPISRQSVESALLIGDKVVNSPPLDDFPYQLDLGEQWKKLTGLPFVYAMWACRTDDASTESIQRAAKLLDRQLRRNLERLGWLVETRAPSFGWPLPLAQRYVSDLLRFRVTPLALEGLHAFAKRSESLGLGTAPRVADEWMDKPGPIAR